MSTSLTARRRRGLIWGGAALALAMALSMLLGSHPVPAAEVWSALVDFDPGNDRHLVIRALRGPRMLVAVMAGASLGMAGALMQAVTRNPLAEPGLLGLNAGAAVAVVFAIAVLGLSRISDYVWFGMIGAGLAGMAVFFLGRAHRAGVDPVRLVLAGAGLSVVLGALTGIVVLNTPLLVLDAFRGWSAGSVAGRDMEVAKQLAAAMLVGGTIAILLAPRLNALALGQDIGRALGVSASLVWALACLAVMVLAGGATAAAGPIGFVGLVAPHMARMAGGPDYRWILPFSALFAALILLLADVLGRVIAMPDEVPAGIIATLAGGPFFVWTVRRFRMARL